MFVNAEFEQRAPRPRTEACFRSAALQPSRSGADGKPFSSHARAKALVIRISWSSKNPRLAYAWRHEKKKGWKMLSSLLVCRRDRLSSAISDDSRYISINSSFWGTKSSFVTLWLLLLKKLGFEPLAPSYRLVIAALLLRPAVLYGKRHSPAGLRSLFVSKAVGKGFLLGDKQITAENCAAEQPSKLAENLLSRVYTKKAVRMQWQVICNLIQADTMQHWSATTCVCDDLLAMRNSIRRIASHVPFGDFFHNLL